jgi:Na+/phosphate symporter
MSAVESCISYTGAVFVLLFITGLAINLLNKHYILQLSGIAFFFTYFFFRSTYLLKNSVPISDIRFYETLLIASSGISACLLSMVLGFWIFPAIRGKFKK